MENGVSAPTRRSPSLLRTPFPQLVVVRPANARAAWPMQRGARAHPDPQLAHVVAHGRHGCRGARRRADAAAAAAGGAGTLRRHALARSPVACPNEPAARPLLALPEAAAHACACLRRVRARRGSWRTSAASGQRRGAVILGRCL
jgi:hypothetical protein